MDQRKEAMAILLDTIEKTALNRPDQLQMFIAESTAVLAMNGFMEEELAEFDSQIQKIIDVYLGGSLLDSTIVRDNEHIH